MLLYNETLVEFNLVQHQISFAGLSDVRFPLLKEAQRGKCNERSLPYHVMCENRMLR